MSSDLKRFIVGHCTIITNFWQYLVHPLERMGSLIILRFRIVLLRYSVGFACCVLL